MPQRAVVDLRKMAYQAMLANGFRPDPPPEGVAQVQSAVDKWVTATSDAAPPDGYRDLRQLLWSSIDNIDSLDLDQIEYAERVGAGVEADIRLMIGIADVDCLVGKGSPLDTQAAWNCSSVYSGVRLFPMLPEKLSNELSSLMENEDRRVVVIDMVIDLTGEVKSSDVYLAMVRNRAKLAYDHVTDWLENGATLAALERVDGLEQQLRLQDELTGRLQRRNQKNGALSVQTLEARPVSTDGKVTGLELTRQSRARDIIQNFMVTANTSLAQKVHERGLPMLQRIVKKPARWPRLVTLAKEYGFTLPTEPDAPSLSNFVAERKSKDPEHFPDLSLMVVKLLGPGEYVVQAPGEVSQGHFGLAVHDYTHATAPNRRYADLVTQRITKAFVQSWPCPYTVDELRAVAQRCQDREEAARKVERVMRKAAAAMLLSTHIGDTYEGIVTGVASKGTFVRLIDPPAEGRVVCNEGGLDVGDKIMVRLVATEPSLGFIDFERITR